MSIAFGIKDAIDILLVAILLYQTYKLMRNTGTANIFAGVLMFVVVWFLIVKVFKLELMGAILNQLISVGAIALIVIFQNEIRRFFQQLGSRKRWKLWHKMASVFKSDGNAGASAFPVMKLVLACRNMSRTKTGALIVIQRDDSLKEYIDTGDEINADINTRLIENIFFKNSPLHDGAMIIVDDRIVTAGAILPVSKNPDIPRHLGLRHRAAMGVSEKCDAIVIIVSEETGTITMAINGAYKLNLTPEDLERQLTLLLNSEANDN